MERESLINYIKENDKGIDEREIFIKRSSYLTSQYGVYLVMGLLYVLRMISGQDFVADIVMIMMGQATLQTLYLYKNDRNKKLNLGLSIFTAIIFFIGLYQTMVFYEII